MQFHSNHQESLRFKTMTEVNYWLMKSELDKNISNRKGAGPLPLT